MKKYTYFILSVLLGSIVTLASESGWPDDAYNLAAFYEAEPADPDHPLAFDFSWASDEATNEETPATVPDDPVDRMSDLSLEDLYVTEPDCPGKKLTIPVTSTDPLHPSFEWGIKSINEEHQDSSSSTLPISPILAAQTMAASSAPAKEPLQSDPLALLAGEAFSRKRFKCEKCNKGYKTRDILRKHNRRTHLEKKPFSCSECGEEFRSKESLTSHNRFHNKERPFGCKVCKRRYYRNDSLVAHRRVHTGYKPSKCIYCDKEFFNNQSLKRHMNKQIKCTKEEIRHCEYCGKKFSTKFNLARHKKGYCPAALKFLK